MTRVSSPETLRRAAIEDREVYGALAGEKVLVASAASPAVAQFVSHAAGARPVEDVVAAKPASNALAASVLPLVLAGILTGALAAHLTRRRGRRAGLVFGGALLTGGAATLIVQTWLGVVGGDWFANAGALTLTVLAMARSSPGSRPCSARPAGTSRSWPPGRSPAWPVWLSRGPG